MKQKKLKGKIKLIFFDLEGTIFRKLLDYDDRNVAPSAWTKIAQRLGSRAEAEEDETKDLWSSGSYKSYIEWMKATINVYKKYGLSKDLFFEVMNEAEYYPGVKETFKALKRRGYVTVIISGGFKAQADNAQKELKIDHSFAACEYFFDKEGKLEHWNLLPCDYEGKLDFMNLIVREYKLKPEQCAFVADGKNDIALAKMVGVSIAFNADPELQKVATYSINQPNGKEDFKAILKCF